jgi:hypothetical protein
MDASGTGEPDHRSVRLIQCVLESLQFRICRQLRPELDRFAGHFNEADRIRSNIAVLQGRGVDGTEDGNDVLYGVPRRSAFELAIDEFLDIFVVDFSQLPIFEFLKDVVIQDHLIPVAGRSFPQRAQP